jgi:hypothetical protein
VLLQVVAGEVTGVGSRVVDGSRAIKQEEVDLAQSLKPKQRRRKGAVDGNAQSMAVKQEEVDTAKEIKPRQRRKKGPEVGNAPGMAVKQEEVQGAEEVKPKQRRKKREADLDAFRKISTLNQKYTLNDIREYSNCK